MHAVLEAAARMLLPEDRCVLVSDRPFSPKMPPLLDVLTDLQGVALENNSYMIVAAHSESQAAIIGLTQTEGY